MLVLIALRQTEYFFLFPSQRPELQVKDKSCYSRQKNLYCLFVFYWRKMELGTLDAFLRAVHLLHKCYAGVQGLNTHSILIQSLQGSNIVPNYPFLLCLFCLKKKKTSEPHPGETCICSLTKTRD